MLIFSYWQELMYVLFTMTIIFLMAWIALSTMRQCRYIIQRLFIMAGYAVATFLIVSFVSVYWWVL